MRYAAKLRPADRHASSTRPGAYPGMGAEERGQSIAIAESILQMSRLPVPIVTVVTGEGGSGGALALAVGRPRADAGERLLLGDQPRGLRDDPVQGRRRPRRGRPPRCRSPRPTCCGSGSWTRSCPSRRRARTPTRCTPPRTSRRAIVDEPARAARRSPPTSCWPSATTASACSARPGAPAGTPPIRGEPHDRRPKPIPIELSSVWAEAPRPGEAARGHAACQRLAVEAGDVQDRDRARRSRAGQRRRRRGRRPAASAARWPERGRHGRRARRARRLRRLRGASATRPTTGSRCSRRWSARSTARAEPGAEAVRRGRATRSRPARRSASSRR